MKIRWPRSTTLVEAMVIVIRFRFASSLPAGADQAPLASAQFAM